MTIAAIMTVRNEEPILRSNLLYHHLLGVDHFLIYDNKSDDGTADSVRDLPFVEIFPMTSPESLESDPDAIRLLDRIRAEPTRFPFRATANAFHAARAARNRGCKWLLHIDADELVCIDSQTAAVPGQLRSYLNRVDSDVEVVRFQLFEVCQQQLAYGNVFADETLFKSPEFQGHRFGDRILNQVSRLGRRCFGTRDVLDPLLRRIASACRAPRRDQRTRKVFNPLTGRLAELRWFYGDRRGKVAGRLSADVIPMTCHAFEHRNGERPIEEVKHRLLHYIAYSFESFLTRARVRPDNAAPHALFPQPKWLFNDIVNQSGLPVKQLEELYERWILFDAEEVEHYRRNAETDNPVLPKIVEITGPKKTFELLRGRDAVSHTLSRVA